MKQPYVVAQRWLGGTATNFITIKKLLKKLSDFEKQHEDPIYAHLTKKEKLITDRKRKKLSTLLSGISMLKKLPGAFFVVDAMKEMTAVKEANKLNIPVFGIVDSNSSCRYITYPIPGNDDTILSIQVIMEYMYQQMEEGLKTWESEKQKKYKSQSTEENKVQETYK